MQQHTTTALLESLSVCVLFDLQASKLANICLRFEYTENSLVPIPAWRRPQIDLLVDRFVSSMDRVCLVSRTEHK